MIMQGKKITFISYFTVKPVSEEIERYLDYFSRNLLEGRDDVFWVTGRNVKDRDLDIKNVSSFNDLGEMINKM